ncbi:MAG TPA: PKD domain-containing protein [Thermoanaerobaculia bacterium]
MRARTVAALLLVWCCCLSGLHAGEPPALHDTDEGCPEARIVEYLERHGDYGRIDPEIMLELTRQVKASREAARFAPSAIGGSVWRSIGPTNGAGRATALALHPSITGTAIIGAAGGGAWKTTDGGQTWRVLTDDMPNLSVGAITYAPSDPSIVYLGTGEGGYAGDFIPGIGLLTSSDGGETWTLPSSVVATQFYKFIVNPSDPKNILAATNAGLLRSTNGQNGPWKEVIRSLAGNASAGFGDVTDLVSDPTDAQVIYATTWDRRFWCAKQKCSAELAFQSPTVMKSVDGGDTWTQAATGLPVSTATMRVNRLAIAIAPSSPQTLYVSTSTLDNATGQELSRIYKTTDGGASWSETDLSKSTSSTVLTYLGTQAWYDNVIIVSPADPNIVVAGGVVYVRTMDGGTTWARVMTNVHADAHEFRFDSAGMMWIANDGGIYTSPNSGAAASDRNTGLVTRQFYDIANDPANRNRVYGGQQDNGTIVRGDAGGTSWSGFSGGDGFACAVHSGTPAIAYSTIQFGLVLRTVTAGTINRVLRRTPPYDSSETTPFYSILMTDPHDPSTIYTVSNRVWKSKSGGDGWVPLSIILTDGNQMPSDTSIRTMAISMSDPSVIMIALASPRRRVYRTTNGGASWIDVTNNLPPGRTILHLEIDPQDSHRAFAALAGTSGPSVWFTPNGGIAWEARSNGLPSFSAQTVRFDPIDSTTVYAGTDVGVYRSIDSGLSWQRFGTGMPAVSVYDVDPLNDGTILRAATHGRGVWELVIGEPPNAPPAVVVASPATSQLTVAKGTTLSFIGTISDLDLDPIDASWTFPDTWTSVKVNSGETVKHRFDRPGRFPVGLSATDARAGIGATTVEVDVLDPADSCSAPVEIAPAGPFPYSVTINTDLATKEGSDPRSPLSACYPFNPQSSTWASFTPVTSGDYQFSLCGSAVSAVLVGYTGDACGTLTSNGLCIARQSATTDCSSSSTTQTISLSAGQTVRLFLTNYFSNDWGDITLTVTQNSALSLIVTSVAPPLAAPGTSVVINGLGFQPGATVTIGGVRADNVVVVSPKIITATIGQRSGGSSDVIVHNSDGTTSTQGNGFTYVTVDTGPKRRAVRR